MTPLRVLVCGGRDFTDRACIELHLNAVDRTRGVAEVITGGARGADLLAHEWANRMGVKATMMVADWETHGRSAGAIRNVRMLKETKPDMVLAFPGGKGTAHMVKIAHAANVPVLEIKKQEPKPVWAQRNTF